jgi:AcrR family transcriptional regulator
MKDPKEKLIHAVLNLLEAGIDPEEMTTRQIASEAEMAHGLINYHFGSKEAILKQAVSQIIQQEVGSVEDQNYQVSSLRERLLTLLMTQSQMGMNYEALLRFDTKLDIHQGCKEPIMSIMPLLRKHYGNKRNEEELLLLAAQIMQPLQLFFSSPELLQDHLGWDLSKSPEQRMRFFKILLNNLGIE